MLSIPLESLYIHIRFSLQGTSSIYKDFIDKVAEIVQKCCKTKYFSVFSILRTGLAGTQIQNKGKHAKEKHYHERIKNKPTWPKPGLRSRSYSRRRKLHWSCTKRNTWLHVSFFPLLRDKEWCPLISLANSILCFGNIFTLSSIDSKV